MLVYLRDPEDIKRAQSDFQDRFRLAGKIRTVNVGYKGGSEEMKVAWLPSAGIWTGSRILPNRYWNAFGVGEPESRQSNSITCEINFPLSGINRSIAGVLAKDERGAILVLHRGRIGGGKEGVGPALFRKSFSGKWTTVEGDEVVVVTAITSTDFIAQVSNFVTEVARIKRT